MKVLIEYNEDSGDVEIGTEPPMHGDDLSDWLIAVAGELAIEVAMKGELNQYPPTMMQ